MSVLLGPLALSRSQINRAAEKRPDPTWLAAAWDNGATRVCVVSGTSARVEGATEPSLAFVSPAKAPDGERFFLGTDEAGVAYFAVAIPDAGDMRSLREVGTLLVDRDAGLFVAASALANWHATHTHCPRCGSSTHAEAGGWTRRCPADGSEHYPRTDPAVIMAVVDAEDRVLLGHQASWPANRFSTLAGFVEAGESLEQAVRREVAEEAGLLVGEVTYLGNQPWPFPASLMLGFRAQALTTEVRLVDHELSEARWFTRAELAADLASGAVLPPGHLSIARRLLEHWYGEVLPG